MLNLLGRYHNNHKNAQISVGKNYFLLLLKGDLDSIGYSVHRYRGPCRAEICRFEP